MDVKNPKRYDWERDGNGNYVVTDTETGLSCLAIKRLGKPERYCIHGHTGTEMDVAGNPRPRRFSKFELLVILANSSKLDPWII